MARSITKRVMLYCTFSYCLFPEKTATGSDILRICQIIDKSLEIIILDRIKRIWYLSHMRAAKVQASLRIRAVSPEPPLLAHTSSESRGTLRQKARSLAPLNGWACAVKICNDGMLEDTNSLDGAHFRVFVSLQKLQEYQVQFILSSVLSREWDVEFACIDSWELSYLLSDYTHKV